MLRKLLALRHATERIERLEIELRAQQALLADARGEIETLIESVICQEHNTVATRQRLVAAAASRATSEVLDAPDCTTLSTVVAATSPVSGGHVVLAVPGDRFDPTWLGRAIDRLTADCEVDAVVGDRLDVIGGRFVAIWADTGTGSDDGAELPISGAVFRRDAWDTAIVDAGSASAGELGRRTLAQLAKEGRVGVEGVVAAVGPNEPSPDPL